MRRKRFIKRKNKLSGFIYQLKHDLKGVFHKFSRILLLGLILFLVIIFLTKTFFAKPSLLKNTKQNENGILKQEELLSNIDGENTHKNNDITDDNGLVKLKLPNGESENSKNLSSNNDSKSNLINTENVEYKSDDYYSIQNHFDSSDDTTEDLSKFRDIDYLKNHLYIVDGETDITKEMFDVNKFMNVNLKIDDDIGPKVLIFNTHSQEMYKDSKDTSEGVIGLCKELQQILKDKYDIDAIAHEGVYDMVDGKQQVLGSYQRMTPDIEKILKENPSIEVCIDIHRDGLPEDVHLVTNINKKPTAQLMFVNGLSKIFGEDGKLKDAPGLPNPNLTANLAFSFKMKLNANEMYPNLTRKIYLHGYRYSLFMKPKSLLVEVGSQTNTYQEAKNAMEPLADVLAEVIR